MARRFNKNHGLALAIFVCILMYYQSSLSVEKMFQPVDMSPPGRPEALLNAARKIAAYSKTIMVAIINDAYIPFANSWLCNTKHMDVHKYILFITADDDTAETLKRDWPEVSVASMRIANLKGDRTFGNAGYVRMNVKRHQFVYELLKEGFELFFFEVDCVWLRNPLPYLQGQTGYDLLVNQVSYIQEYNSGFTYVFNTARSVEVWRLLVEDLTALAHRIAWQKDNSHVSGTHNDQVFWTNIIRERVPGIQLKILTLDLFPDGNWYKWTEEERRRRNVTDPFIINNNWIAGNARKKARAKEWDHWFVDDNLKCRMDLVNKIAQKT